MHVLLIVVLAAMVVGEDQHPIVHDGSRPTLPMTYQGAMDFCESLNKHIATPKSKADDVNFMTIMRALQLRRMWIGVHRINDTNDVPPYNWTVHKGAGLSGQVQYWGPKEPNNFRNHAERCLEMRDLKKNSEFANWNDAPCRRRNAFFCVPNE